MTTTEHLDKILAKLDELLATAEQRTPGEWEIDLPHPSDAQVFSIIASKDEGTGTLADCYNYTDEQDKDNAAFIASCAGNAEAGWRATKASIILLINMLKRDHDIETGSAANKALSDILAAWPIESL